MYHFIINPKSKSNLGLKIWTDIENHLKSINFEYKKHITSKPGSATEIVRKITSTPNTTSTIVILGGDGTLNEVLNGIVNFNNIRFAYIPIGSGNDFARGMGINNDHMANLKNIINPTTTRHIDYGIMTIGNESRRFLVSSGIGFDAAVCNTVNKSFIKKWLNRLGLGKLSYTIVAVLQLFKMPYNKIQIHSADTDEYHYSKNLLFSVHVQAFEGGGYMFCPMADPSDRLLDICIADKISKLRALTIIPGIKKGKHVKCKGIFFHKENDFTITINNNCYIHTDGEAAFTTATTKTIHYKTSDNQLEFIN